MDDLCDLGRLCVNPSVPWLGSPGAGTDREDVAFTPDHGPGRAGYPPIEALRREGNLMNTSPSKWVIALAFIVIGVGIGATGIYVGDTDDAPGAGVGGILLMIVAVITGVRMLRKT
jgi:hypothetical protein